MITIKKSTIREAGKGAFANRDIKKHELLAEYKGVLLMPEAYNKKEKHCKSLDYVWQIEDEDGEIICYVDGEKGNWTRYVNCPCTKKQENVVPIQKYFKMYYYAHKNIKKHQELFVWYGSEYAEKLIGRREL